MNKEPIKCDQCGKFVSYDSLTDGSAKRRFLTPDSYLTREEYETTCSQCSKQAATA